MDAFILQIILKSDAAFGRGDGVTGIVDNEIQHDALGCPFLSGKEIKGILSEECAAILSALPDNRRSRWIEAAGRLFGRAGSKTNDSAWLKIGDAHLPQDLVEALQRQLEARIAQIDPKDNDHYLQEVGEAEAAFRVEVLESLTTTRQQTAIDEETGTAKDHSLRVTRVIIRETPFEADLLYLPGLVADAGTMAKRRADDFALLAACARAFRRAGTGRTRGRGRLEAQLCDGQRQPVTDIHYRYFAQEVLK